MKKILTLALACTLMFGSVTAHAFSIGISAPKVSTTKVTNTKKSSKNSKKSTKTTVTVQPTVNVGSGGVYVSPSPSINIGY